MPAVVLEVGENSARVYTARSNEVTLDWEGLEWAREFINPNTMGPELTSAGEILVEGDLVYIRPVKNGDEESWALTQLPEVSGALVSLDAHSGAILALTGGQRGAPYPHKCGPATVYPGGDGHRDGPWS